MTYKVDQSWIEDFNRDGAGVLRGVLPPEWVSRMRAAIDADVQHMQSAESRMGMNLAKENKADKGAFFNDLFLWREKEDFRAFAFDSPLPEVAAQVLEVGDVRLFYDQLFVMEPGGETPTDWHQDLPYWPIKGPDVLSIWAPFDSVSPENGVLSYIRGSHRWTEQLRPASPRLRAAGQVDDHAKSTIKLPRLDEPSDEVLSWNLEPGDVLVHHGLTVHGARANRTSDRRRRAIAIRYTGPQTLYDPRPGTWIHDSRVQKYLPLPTIDAGAPLSGELFPKVWSAGAPATRETVDA